MKALRWILFSLLAFGLGTGAAFALHPPTIGIPEATASGLSGDLTKIRDYAAQGRCDAVRGRIRGATAKIDGLPSRTATATVEQLTDSLETVRTEALSACQRVSDAKIADQQAQEAQEQAEATPAPSTPVEPSEPATTPEEGDEGITQDDGGDTAPEGQQPDGGVNPDDPTGQGGPSGPGNSENSNGNPGGVVIPGEGAIRQRVEKERRKWEKQADQIRKAWGQ